MISVKLLHNYLIKLKKNTGITIQLSNLLFDSEFGFGEFVNSIELPAKEINGTYFTSFHTEDGYQHYPSGVDFYKNSAEIFKDTVKILNGRFETRQASESTYSLDIFSGFQGFEFLNDKLSTLLDRLNPALIGFTCENAEELIQHAKDQNADVNSKYYFPVIKNEFFYGDSNEEFKGYLNRWDSVNQKFYVNPYDVGTGAFNNYDALCPQMKLYYLLKEIFNFYNISIAGDFIDEIDNNDVLIYNNKSLDQSFSKRAVFANNGGQNLGLGGGLFSFDLVTQDLFQIFTVATGKLRIFREGRIIIDILLIFTPVPAANYTGKVFKNGVEVFSVNLDVLSFPDGYKIHYDFVAIAADVTQDLTFAVFNDDGSALDLQPSSIFIVDIENPDAGYNGYTNVIHMKNHVLDITLGDLISKLKNSLGLSLDYDSNQGVINFNFIKPVISANPSQEFTSIASKKYLKKILPPPVKSVSFLFPDDDDLSISVIDSINTLLLLGSYSTSDDLPAPTITGQIAFIKNTSSIVETTVDPITNDHVWSNKKFYYPKINYLEKGETDIKLEVTPLLMTTDFDSDTVKSLKPYVAQRGSSSAFQIGDNNNTSVRLIYWKGLVENSNAELYPLATSGSIDTMGNDIGTREFRLDGAKGLIENCWGKWFETLNIGIVWTRKFYFNILHMLNFNINKTFRCGNHSFMPKTGSINIESTSSVIEAEMDYIEVIP